MFDEKVLARYWIKVRKTDECWEWIAGKRGKTGYGSFKINGVVIDTHRVSWMIHFGPIPDGKCVLHKCDNRVCIRPDHLFLGTQLDNIRDMDKKGRRSIPKKGREKPVMHGTITEYKSHKCRCALCKEAQKQHQRKWRNTRKVNLCK